MKRLFAIVFLLAELLHATKAQSADISLLPKLSECGHVNEEYLYSENVTTNLDEFPWMARIVLQNQYLNTLCQGVLISKRYLITVAQCVQQDSPVMHSYGVVLGDWDTANNITEKDCTEDGRCAPLPKLYDIEEIIIHPSYHMRAADNDIALVRLVKEVLFSAYIQPICLPTAADSQQLVGNYYHLAGFGANFTTFRVDVSYQIVKSVSHVTSLEHCSGLFLSEMSENNVCGNCLNEIGQLGSMALMGVRTENSVPKNFYLIAILSRNLLICRPTERLLFVRVLPYFDWLKYNIVE